MDTFQRCGAMVTNPRRGRYWCDSCNAARLNHIAKQLEALREKMA